MASDSHSAAQFAVPVILVPEVRDFVRINADLVALLNLGHGHIRLEGADGQRLLAAGLAGNWQAVVEIYGRTGPEVAGNLNAPGLRIILNGSTLDGAGRGLQAGSILIRGDAGDGLGACQAGGLLVVTGAAGHRAGLNQEGGILIVGGQVGNLAADRQSGGRFFLGSDGAGAHVGRGRRGGSLVRWDETLDAAAQLDWDESRRHLAPWLDPVALSRP